MVNITIIGAGYVGLGTGAGLAELGHNIICVDNNIEKIEMLNNSQMPIFEPGLSEVIQKNIDENRLKFTSDIRLGLDHSDIIFLAVNTPDDGNGDADLSFLYKALEEILINLTQDIFIVIKSTVPIGTNEKITKFCSEKSTFFNIEIISNPEFLREGSALHDFFHPSRIIVGTNSKKSIIMIAKIYEYFDKKLIPILYTDPASAELIKYASNAFLATKIAFINEMSDLCEYYGANINNVSKSMGLDSRIGPEFLKVGPGFGGSCFPKDISALNRFEENSDCENNIVKAVIQSNNNRKKRMANKILNILPKDLTNITIGCLGVSFKANTDDIRESPAIHIIQYLLEHNIDIKLYDPAAMNNAKKILADKVSYFDNAYDAVSNTNALIIFTEWEEFKSLDYERINKSMEKPLIIDLRNLLDEENIIKKNFEYYSLGKK